VVKTNLRENFIFCSCPGVQAEAVSFGRLSDREANKQAPAIRRNPAPDAQLLLDCLNLRDESDIRPPPPAAAPAEAQGKSPARVWLHWVGVGASVLIFGISIVVLARAFATIDWRELRAAMAATGWDQISAAVAMTALSYLALTGYDALAVRQLDLKVPYRRTSLASFASYAISFTLGFPLLTAGTVRYWLYSQSGVSAAKVASLTLIAGVTFWLGMGLVVGSALVFDPAGIAEINRLKVAVNMLIGVGVLSCILIWLGLAARGRRRLRILGFDLELPGLGLTFAQMALGVVDLCAAASALYLLLPAGHATEFVHFVAAYVFGCVLGIVSHVPGGIGPFEMTMLKAVTTPTQEGLLASLLIFRIVYYLIPFVLALALIGAHEGMRRWTALREAIERAQDEEAGKQD
jgi:uncharacterized membrane protein YbhN (UPF0104 family)